MSADRPTVPSGPSGGAAASAGASTAGSAANANGEDKFDVNEVIAALKANESAKLKYEMLGALGKGKFSTVYRARCVDGSAMMALKKVQVCALIQPPSVECKGCTDFLYFVLVPLTFLCHHQIFEMMDVRSREKCLKEIRLLQSLNHSNIIRYVDSYIDNNELIIVLEFAEGGDLKGCVDLVPVFS
jgi:serine/threonine protein kinase